MILGSHKSFPRGCHSKTSADLGVILNYTLEMTPEEFHKAIGGETIRHLTACNEMSGVWEVKFKKNSKAKHNRIVHGR